MFAGYRRPGVSIKLSECTLDTFCAISADDRRNGNLVEMEHCQFQMAAAS